jgi:hypothetical protein
MKQFNLEISQQKKQFLIHLGNGQWLKFDNKTRAEKYRRKYKRILKDNVYMLNLLQPNVNQLFRQSYFQMNHFEIRQIKELLQNFDDRFDYIFKNFSSGNQNAFVFQNIDTCFYCLLETTKQIHIFGQKHKNYNLTAQTKPLIKHLQYLLDSFNQDKTAIRLNDSYTKVKSLNSSKNERNTNTKH